MFSLFVLTQNNGAMAQGYLHQAKRVPGHWKHLHWRTCSKAWQPTVSVFWICKGLSSNSTSNMLQSHELHAPDELTQAVTLPTYSGDVRFESRPTDWLSLLRSLLVFLRYKRGKIILVQAAEAFRVASGWGSHIFRHSAHRWRQGCQPYAPAGIPAPELVNRVIS
jgi:hypothetical protein